MHGYFGDGTPITKDFATEFSHVVNAASWIDMLAAPKLWAALRRIPPKTFLLELVETYLEYARSRRHYAYIPEEQERPDLSLRGPAVQRLRDLLLGWEPPLITPEIQDAARAVYLTEYGAPPKESWDEAEHNFPDTPLEASLIWPAGPWDEEAFLAARVDNEPPSEL